MNKQAETPSSHDSLGTPWRFDVFTGRLGTIYAIDVGRDRYRIAPDQVKKDKWRIDVLDILIWTALNSVHYATPHDAAKDLVRMEQAGKIGKLASNLETKWGQTIKVGRVNWPGLPSHNNFVERAYKETLHGVQHLGDAIDVDPVATTDLELKRAQNKVVIELIEVQKILERKYS